MSFSYICRFLLTAAVFLSAAVFTFAAEPVQSIYPAVGKIIGRGEKEHIDGEESQPVYFGSGVYTAESGELGIVLTNWHVVNGVTEGLEVRFPGFQSQAAVILADEVWDLAALVIRKPPFVPVPISLEVPQIGDELWVAGYGGASGLEEFRISSGPVLRYSIIDYSAYEWLKEPLPGETLMIGTGVRFGDSGGPILNRYGELAGLLWGSDGYLTMGTFCLRVQAFLTQAQYQLVQLPPQAGAFFSQAEQKKIPIKKISVATVPAQKALALSGVFPISSVSVYTAPKPSRPLRHLPDFYKPASKTAIQEEAAKEGNAAKSASSKTEEEPNPDFVQKQKAYIAAHHSGYTLPPYPPMESPTLLVQRKTIGREHPEVYPDGMNHPAVQTQQETAQKSLKPEEKKKQPMEMTQTGDSILESSAAEASSGEFQNVSLSDEPDPSAVTTASRTEGETADQPADAATGAEGGKALKDHLPILSKMPLSDIQTILVAMVILFLFINSLRLLSIAAERQKSSKGEK